MLSKLLLLLLLALATAVLAVPPPPQSCSSGDDNRGHYTPPPPPPPSSSSPTLPLNGRAKELSPPDGLQLLHMALGLGIQNYTCAAAGAAPVPVGALAVLWDVRPLAATSSFAAVPGRVLRHSHALFASRQTLAAPPPADLDLAAVIPGFSPPAELAFLGRHFFDHRGVPTFVLVGGAPLSLQKDEAVDAPDAADPGPDHTGAVSWLRLRVVAPANATESTAADAPPAVKLVYRVLTAGGNSHGCSAPGTDSTSYAATYWFFG